MQDVTHILIYLRRQFFFSTYLRPFQLLLVFVNLILSNFNMRWFRKVATVVIFDELRADEGDLVSEELRKKSCTVYPEKCNKAVVWI